MKGRLDELMRQAIAECKPDDNLSKDRTLQRFAELIIAECAEVADKNFNKGFSPVGQLIKEHFEVK